ncbi:MAG: LysM peptidoglycan-binding domain-containing protein [Saezia sp.]
MKLPVSRKTLQVLALSVMASASMAVYAQSTTTDAKPVIRERVITSEQQAAATTAQNGVHISEIRDDAPLTYRVQSGDTLWGISGRYLRSPWKWPALWGMNKEQIANPHLIYPGQMLTMVRNGDLVSLTTSQGRNDGTMPTVRLSPHVRIEDVTDNAIPVLPPEAVIPFMRNGIIVSQHELDNTARIIAEQEGRLLLRTGDKIYARGADADAREIKNYMAYANPVAITDPDNKKNILGYQATFLGRLQFLREGSTANPTANKNETASTFVITDIKQEIRVGDRLTPAGNEQDLLTDFVPHAAPDNMSGRIAHIYSQTAHRHTALYGVILLSRGQLDGLERGHVVALWRPGKVVTDSATSSRGQGNKVSTPDERYGLAMVFKTFDHLAYALIVQTGNMVELGDSFTAP